ncbi:phosphatidate cytidylyltransferase family protein [Methanocella paludicola SANAE]|uniref:Phosphatidate cytidylyltransferase family protein n=1 Tax=Methanocella paludicola (strain DSM 17711 / JCM 13418 / NBRC 101707 / SANAE) TaxID=304371 RepID=D1Z278_METPS|nr:phosphatidate cytidylyltransferase [Methanocella paludicola]BAI62800.1 phosphatidate cytidylyltransferase family protein [Methanocella paludicola SANAE]
MRHALATSWLPRKLVHISGAAFAFLALFSRQLSLLIVMAGIITFFTLEALRRRADLPFVSALYRDSERKSIALEPLLYLLCIAMLLAMSMVFDRGACLTAIIVLTVGDGLAGIAGRAFGRHRLPQGKKTWEGSISGFIAASAVGFLFAGPLAIAGAAAGMAAEAYSRRLENLSVAAASFLTMAILSLLL